VLWVLFALCLVDATALEFIVKNDMDTVVYSSGGCLLMLPECGGVIGLNHC
jgi:hypothetical protein